MKRPSFRIWTSIGVLGFGALGMLAACNDKITTAPSAVTLKPSSDPNLAAVAPFNDEGVCLAADAYLSNFTSGVNSENSLLADPTKETAGKYGVLMANGQLANRWTFYIDKTGKIAYIEKKVQPATSAEDMVAKLGELKVPMTHK